MIQECNFHTDLVHELVGHGGPMDFLPLIPLADIAKGLAYAFSKVDLTIYPEAKVEKFKTYVHRTWGGTFKKAGWNVHELYNKFIAGTLTGYDIQQRSNNFLESFNKYFKAKFPTTNPQMDVFVKVLRETFATTLENIRLIEQGHLKPPVREPVKFRILPPDFIAFQWPPAALVQPAAPMLAPAMNGGPMTEPAPFMDAGDLQPAAAPMLVPALNVGVIAAPPMDAGEMIAPATDAADMAIPAIAAALHPDDRPYTEFLQDPSLYGDRDSSDDEMSAPAPVPAKQPSEKTKQPAKKTIAVAKQVSKKKPAARATKASKKQAADPPIYAPASAIEGDPIETEVYFYDDEGDDSDLEEAIPNKRSAVATRAPPAKRSKKHNNNKIENSFEKKGKSYRQNK